jgi:hypothetical protein
MCVLRVCVCVCMCWAYEVGAGEGVDATCQCMKEGRGRCFGKGLDLHGVEVLRESTGSGVTRTIRQDQPAERSKPRRSEVCRLIPGRGSNRFKIGVMRVLCGENCVA